jgi:hypothetical protein
VDDGVEAAIPEQLAQLLQVPHIALRSGEAPTTPLFLATIFTFKNLPIQTIPDQAEASLPCKASALPLPLLHRRHAQHLHEGKVDCPVSCKLLQAVEALLKGVGEVVQYGDGVASLQQGQGGVGACGGRWGRPGPRWRMATAGLTALKRSIRCRCGDEAARPVRCSAWPCGTFKRWHGGLPAVVSWLD